MIVLAALLLMANSQAGAEVPYFQQRLYYNIKVDLDPESAKLAGIENISYFNNSPDSLKEIYFHLYYNAFQPGSYLDKQDRRSGDFRITNTLPRNRGNVDIDLLRINGDTSESFHIDNTIMTVPLPKPLAPGDSVSFYIEFTSQIPARGSRTARRGKHFDIGQWYPKPAVYDRYGWHVHQYLDYEFYADYGDFDIELTLPSDYIVAHDGRLLNEEEIFGARFPVPQGDSIIVDALKGIARDTLKSEDSVDEIPDIPDNVSEGEWVRVDSDSARETDEPAGDAVSRRTWKIRAENVHDFAFCADPKFVVDVCRYKDVIIKVYYDNSIKRTWGRDAADYTRESIKFFSEKYYPYPYGQYSTVASLVGGGMEYPQLTMINRRYGRRDYTHGLESVIAHEVGHAWFYGILGFNETEQSYLDEGLATFVTNLYLENRYGRFHNDFSYKKAWQRKYLPNGNERNNNLRTYIRRARDRDEDPMITPANLFATGLRYYNASYEKASSVYFMLQYTLGDEGFDRFMHLLFERWALKHPYLSDLQELAEEVYGGDLDWFFRQWFTTTWRLDYSLDGLKREKTESGGVPGYNATLSIGKRARCISPLDVDIRLKDGTVRNIRIPVEAWVDGEKSFDTTVFVDSKPKKAVLNSDGRLADINRLNNSTGIPPSTWQLLLPRFVFEDRYTEYYVDSYTVTHQPLLWYNSVDGASPGYRFYGSYIGEAHKLDASISVGAMNGHTDYFLSYENPLATINPDIRYFINSKEEDGRGRQALGLIFSRGSAWYSNYRRVMLSLRRNYMFDDNYIYGEPWSSGDVNTIELNISRGFRNRLSRVDYDASIITSIPGGNYDFTRLEGSLVLTIFGIIRNQTRITLMGGLANGEVPFQQRFFLSSADPYEIWGSPLFRSKGTLPDEWKRKGHLFKPGGAGLNGYLDRGMTGTRMLSAKISRELPSIRIPFDIHLITDQIRRIVPEIYVVSGLVWQRKENPRFKDYLSEAGLKLSYEIPYLDRFIDENKLVFYMPIWISDPSADENEFEWRWMFSVIQ